MTINNRIEGIFRLTSPLHTASPDASLAKADNETPTAQMRIVTDNGTQTIPYFPGNDLRGRLRRKAAALVLDNITATSKVKLELYLGMMAGAISASPDKSELTIEEVLRARDNVYMGLFGGAARLLRSRYRVSDLIPVIADTIARGMVPEHYGEIGEKTFTPQFASGAGLTAAKGYQLVQTTQILRVDDVLRVIRPDELEQYIGDPEAIAEYQNEILASSSIRKADKAKAKAGEIKKEAISKKTGIGNIASYQSIVPGTPMYFLLDFLDDVSNAHVGLMLLALQQLVREQALGGWVRAGLGRFDSDLTLIRNGEKMSVFKPGENGANATLSDSVMQQFVGDAKTAMSKLTEAEMLAFFMNRATEPTAEAA